MGGDPSAGGDGHRVAKAGAGVAVDCGSLEARGGPVRERSRRAPLPPLVDSLALGGAGGEAGDPLPAHGARRLLRPRSRRCECGGAQRTDGPPGMVPQHRASQGARMVCLHGEGHRGYCRAELVAGGGRGRAGPGPPRGQWPGSGRSGEFSTPVLEGSSLRTWTRTPRRGHGQPRENVWEPRESPDNGPRTQKMPGDVTQRGLHGAVAVALLLQAEVLLGWNVPPDLCQGQRREARTGQSWPPSQTVRLRLGNKGRREGRRGPAKPTRGRATKGPGGRPAAGLVCVWGGGGTGEARLWDWEAGQAEGWGRGTPGAQGVSLCSAVHPA